MLDVVVCSGRTGALAFELEWLLFVESESLLSQSLSKVGG